MAGFNKCLAFGKKYELESIKHLEYDTYEFSEGLCKEWDLKTIKDNKETYYEIKSETNCYKYGNILVEFECNNMPSCIASTIADYWIHFAISDKVNNKYMLTKTPVAKLREMIEKKLYHRIVNCGDGNRCFCYVFRMDLFYPYKIALT